MEIQRFGGASQNPNPFGNQIGQGGNFITNNYNNQVTNIFGSTTNATLPHGKVGRILMPEQTGTTSVPNNVSTVINNFYNGAGTTSSGTGAVINNFYQNSGGAYSGYSNPGYYGSYGAASSYSGNTGYGMYGTYGSNYGNAASQVQNNYGNTYNIFGYLGGGNLPGLNQQTTQSQLQQPLNYQTSGGQFTQNNYGTTYNYFANNTGQMSQTQPQPPQPTSGTLKKEDDGSINYTTTGGWKVNVNGTTINMTSPDGKDTTKVWGDPHVVEADGSKWDFPEKTSTFQLPDGTKITMSADSPTGVTKNTEIYDKAQLVKIDNAKMTFESKVDAANTKKADAAKDDGAYYTTNNQGNDWNKTTAPTVPTTSTTNTTGTTNNAYNQFLQSMGLSTGATGTTGTNTSGLSGVWPYSGYSTYQGTNYGTSGNMIPSLGSTPTLSYDALYIQAMNLAGSSASNSINSPLLAAGMLSNYIQPGYQTTVPNYSSYGWSYYPPYQRG